MIAGRADLEAILGGVIRQALADSSAAGLVVLDPGSPEGRLVLEIAGVAIGSDRVVAASASPGNGSDGPEREELERMGARIAARKDGLLVAHPSNKTALLLGGDLPPERLLPLGDLYASDVASMMGEATLPADALAMAEAAGGIGALDACLSAWLESRHPLDDALASLPPAAAAAIANRLSAKRTERRWPRCVPKLGPRTLWIDVFE